MPHACSTCRHFCPGRSEGRSTPAAIGECRANPPASSYAWPRVRVTDFCSQWSDTAKAAFATQEAPAADRGGVPVASPILSFDAGTNGEPPQTTGAVSGPECRPARGKRSKG